MSSQMAQIIQHDPSAFSNTRNDSTPRDLQMILAKALKKVSVAHNLRRVTGIKEDGSKITLIGTFQSDFQSDFRVVEAMDIWAATS
jgi:hypothetical protein